MIHELASTSLPSNLWILGTIFVGIRRLQETNRKRKRKKNTCDFGVAIMLNMYFFIYSSDSRANSILFLVAIGNLDIQSHRWMRNKRLDLTGPNLLLQTIGRTYILSETGASSNGITEPLLLAQQSISERAPLTCSTCTIHHMPVSLRLHGKDQ